MPVYDYECPLCQRQYGDVLVQSHRSTYRCADCGAPARRKPVVSRVAEVRGTGNGPIGRGLQDRAELGQRRRAEWE